MTVAFPVSTLGEPTWEVARLFPTQGEWSETDYLQLATNRLVEFADGVLEFPPMPTKNHQLILQFLYRTLYAFVSTAALGEVFIAPYRVRLWPGRFREPDLIFLATARAASAREQFTDDADWVMEVVSADDPQRDWIVKRAEYARARIPEYWIVDPHRGTVTVLVLPDGQQDYIIAGEYRSGERARSTVLAGFEVEVDAGFSA